MAWVTVILSNAVRYSSIKQECTILCTCNESVFPLNYSQLDAVALDAGFSAFSSSHEVACAQHRFETVVSLTVPVVFAAIVVLGVVGNSLVLAVVLCGQQMRNTTNVLILVRVGLVLVFFNAGSRERRNV